MKKIRREHTLTWKRRRKLTMQLLFLSLLYILGWTPSTILSVIQNFSQSDLINDLPQLEYLGYLTYFVCPLQPFICLFGLPELIKTLKRKLKQSKVTPIIIISPVI